jgi:hypothetical protein
MHLQLIYRNDLGNFKDILRIRFDEKKIVPLNLSQEMRKLKNKI